MRYTPVCVGEFGRVFEREGVLMMERGRFYRVADSVFVESHALNKEKRRPISCLTVVTMYNESGEFLERTMEGLFRNLAVSGGDPGSERESGQVTSETEL